MKETVKTSRTAGYLEKIYRALNEDFFNGELEEPIITIQSTPRAYGHVSVAKVWRRKGEARHELNIDAGTLERPIEDVVSTMMHEMIHLFNIAHGVQDCSRGGTYHNMRFKIEAEKHGLIVEHVGGYGWTDTRPSESLIEYILNSGWTEINMSRWNGITAPGNNGGAAKYVCPCCHQSIRATKTVNVICGNCMEKMLEL